MQRQHPDAVFIGSIATSLLKALQFFKLFFILPLFRSEVGNYRSVEMGNDILSGLSPGYRRGSNTPSSFKRSLAFPDISWRSLAHRHKFLLCMLGLLTLLCTVYLYFAITLGSSDLCSGLGGVQRTRCQMRVNLGKAESLKTHHRRLLNVEDSDLLG